jgi:selenocysteine-specific elongation factor
MIVGTAGHIDHGKTTLVRALTGVDTDRLPEEKRRSISIELGYAFLPLPGASQPIGFIDVPGHERLVRTMLAGVTGIDFALLLVAADDGPMPQTREHLAVLSLLGIRRGAVVVTKCDRVSAERLAAVRAEVQALLQHSTLATAPVLAVSATQGMGIAELQALLVAAAQSMPPRAAESGAFRLAVDRAFTLDGVGTVVTGTVHAGTVCVGDEVQLVPGEALARVRSLHAHNQAVQKALAGQRTALALVGVPRDAVRRGQWLVAPEVALQTTRLDLRLTLWHGEARPLRTGTPVHAHLGTADVLGTLAVLDGGDRLAPGSSALAQLLLQQPVGAWWGDQVVLRDAAATRTLAGGSVLDPFAPARYRRTAQRLSELQALQLPDPALRIKRLLDSAPAGIDLGRMAMAGGQRAVTPPAGGLHVRLPTGSWALGDVQLDAARARVVTTLAAYHDRQPDDPGPDAGRLRRLSMPRLPEPLWRGLLDGLATDGRITRSGARVHLPEHGVRLTASEQRLAHRVTPRLAEGHRDGVWVRDLARDLQEPEALLRTSLARLAQRGELHQVVKDLYYAEATLAAMAAVVRDLAAAHDGAVTAAGFRDAAQLGRKRAIQILEYFDRIGLLRRVGDVHRLRSDTALFAGAHR